ncbi:MAG: hypothetical protein NTZ33_08630 [Bacteroidetes bacterium]|nr:hypothetical protein [Bacteroidota bacterium]
MKIQIENAFKNFNFFKIKYLIFIICFLISSCHNSLNNNNIDIDKQSGFEKDTAQINTQLKKILKNDNINNDSVFIMLKALYNQADKINYKKGEGETKFVEGVVNYDLSDYKSALNCFDQANKIATEISDTLLMLKCIENIASVNLSIGDENLAIKLFYELLPYYEKSINKEGIAKVYNIIGYYKATQKDYSSAENYYFKAIHLNYDIGNFIGIEHNKGNLANLYEDIGKYEKAAQIYKELIESLQNEDSKFNLTVTYNNFAMLFKKENLIDSAIYYLHKGISTSFKSEDISMISVLYRNLGECLISKHRYDEASSYLNKSNAYSVKIGDVENQMSSLKLLLQIDSIKGKINDAFNKSMLILVLNDTINERKIKNNLKISELQYENQNKTNIIDNQKFRLLTSKKEKHFLNFLSLLSIITVGLLISFVILIIHNNKKRKVLLVEQLKINELELENAIKRDEINKLRIEKYENEVKIKENEQVATSMALEQKIKLLEIIKKQFSLALKNNITLNTDDINKLLSSIKAQVIDTKEMDLFNKNFSSLHHDFFEKLKQAHPELSKTELKFCAYLKLNLNSNQISSIMNVSIEAIRKSRYRIRKKLNLPESDSLEAYISNI